MFGAHDFLAARGEDETPVDLARDCLVTRDAGCRLAVERNGCILTPQYIQYKSVKSNPTGFDV